MDDDTEQTTRNRRHGTAAHPRERVGSRAWVRTVGLVGSGSVARVRWPGFGGPVALVPDGPRDAEA